MSEIIWPTYYKDFQCIAGECRHTCCKGWEIDIDRPSLKRFKTNKSIAVHIKNGHFLLKENGDCPFLREDGLCKMILDSGEDYLCDICHLHPRFFVEIDGKTFGGIGLSCEAAARVVLDSTEDFAFEGEVPVPNYIKAFCNSEDMVSTRLVKLAGTVCKFAMRMRIFEEMESLYPEWSEAICRASQEGIDLDRECDIINSNAREFTNLATYLLYRHGGNARLCCECSFLIADLVAVGYEIHEACRMFSEEVEYSDVNNALLDEFFG